jgi:arginase
MSDGLAVIGAPSAIGIVPHDDGSVRRLDLAPAALREEGLATRLGALDIGDAEPPPRYADLERPAGRVRNEDDLVSYSHELGACVARCAREDRFAVVVGGDCSIVLGALLGLRDGRAAPGVVYRRA